MNVLTSVVKHTLMITDVGDSIFWRLFSEQRPAASAYSRLSPCIPTAACRWGPLWQP